MLLTILNTALSLTTLVVLLWVVHQYIKARREIRKLITLLHTKTLEKKMDDLLDGLLANETKVQAPAAPSASVPAVPQTTTVAEQRDRLAIIAAGGRPESTLGSPCPWKKSTKWTTTRFEKSTPATRHDSVFA